MRARTATLDFRQFLELLVFTAFYRANPTVGRTATEAKGRKLVPAAEALLQLLETAVLPLAARDSAHVLRGAFSADAELQAFLVEKDAQVRALWVEADRLDGQSDEWVAVNGLVNLLEKHRVLRSVTVRHKSAITGDPSTRQEYVSSLTSALAGECFLDACAHLQSAATVPSEGGSGAAAAAAAGGQQLYPAPQLDFKGFLEAMCRCAHAKYAKVPSMSTCERMRGFLLNLSGEEDEASVITRVTEKAAPPFYDAAREAVPLVGQSESAFATWLACWGEATTLERAPPRRIPVPCPHRTSGSHM